MKNKRQARRSVSFGSAVWRHFSRLYSTRAEGSLKITAACTSCFFAALEKNSAGPADVMSVREKMRRPVRKESSENHLH